MMRVVVTSPAAGDLGGPRIELSDRYAPNSTQVLCRGQHLASLPHQDEYLETGVAHQMHVRGRPYVFTPAVLGRREPTQYAGTTVTVQQGDGRDGIRVRILECLPGDLLTNERAQRCGPAPGVASADPSVERVDELGLQRYPETNDPFRH